MKELMGLVSNVDPHDVPPGGFTVLENLQTTTPGQLTGRRGLIPVTDRIADDTVLAITRFERPEAEWLVWETSAGAIKACKTSDFSVITLGSGYNTAQPFCFAQNRFNVLVGVNGIDRGFRWDGLTSSLEPLGLDAPTAAPTITAVSGGNLEASLDYLCAYRYLDDDYAFAEFTDGTPGSIPSNFSPLATGTTTGSNKTFQWTNIVESNQTRSTKIELWRTLAEEEQVYYRLQFTGVSANQTYIGMSGSVTSSQTSAGNVQLNLPAGHGLVVGARIAVTGHSVGGYNTNHTITAVSATSVVTSVSYTADGTGGTWSLNGFMTDSTADATVQLWQSMAYETPDGRHPIANRFTPPPTYKPFCCFFQDRFWLAGAVNYSTGTVTTNGTTTVTGSGTSWPSTFEDRFIYINGEARPYQIASYSSSTELTLDRATTGSGTGLSYVIAPSPIENDQLWFSEVDEAESVPSQNVIPLQQNTGDHDPVTGITPQGSQLLVMRRRHLYSLTYFRQPEIDASPTLVAHRGAVNNRCYAYINGVGYFMDQCGCYAYDGQSVRPLTGMVQNIFRDDAIEWSLDWRFFVHADLTEETVRFFVNLTLDAQQVGARWLEYNTRTQGWSQGYTVFQLRDSTLIDSRGGAQLRSLYAGQHGKLYVPHTSISSWGVDGVSTQTRGTLTAATSTTLTDSTASFTDAVLDAPVTIISGTGKHQIARITGRTSTELTVESSLSTTPAVGDTYLIGGVELRAKTGLLAFATRGPAGDMYHIRSVRLAFKPTTADASCDIRRYIDHDSSPVTHKLSQNLGTNVTCTKGSADAVVDMKLSRSSLGSQSGLAVWKFGGHNDDRAMADRWIATELRSIQGNERHTFYELALTTTED